MTLRAQINTLRRETLKLSAKELINFESISVNTSLESVAWEFSFTIALSTFARTPFNEGDKIEILADGVPVLNGFIEVISNKYSDKAHSVIVTGRSKTADLVDSTLDGSVQFNNQINLRTVAESLIENLFIDLSLPVEFQAAAQPEDLIKVIVESDISDFLKNENLAEDVGTTYFSVLEKFARKRQVLMTTNGNGDLVFTRGKGSGASKLILQNKVNDPNNNIKEAVYTRNHSKLFNVYSATSQPQRGGFARLTELPPGALLSSQGRIIDPRIRASRKLFIIAENSSDERQSGERAKWEGVTHRSQATSYRVTVSGHSSNGEIWGVNKPVSVIDDSAGINGRMLITGAVFNQNLTEGSTTRLRCLLKEAFVVPEKSLLDTTFFDFLYETTIDPFPESFEDLPLGPA